MGVCVFLFSDRAAGGHPESARPVTEALAELLEVRRVTLSSKNTIKFAGLMFLLFLALLFFGSRHP